MGNHSDDGLDLDRSIFRDACRTGTGLVVNGAALQTHGRCASCPRRLYGDQEASTGVCVDCELAVSRGERCPAGHDHEWLKRDDLAWSRLAYVGIQQVEAGEDGPAYALEIRNCACRSSLCRVVAAEGVAA